MTSAVIKFCNILLLVGVCVADVDELPAVNNTTTLTKVCLGCLCQAISGCKEIEYCEGDTCGLFRITRGYWADAGKPTLPGQASDDSTAYYNCTVDPGCAAQTVQGYMARFEQDCNNDGKVDCLDHIAIHKKGGYGCSGGLPSEYVNVFNECIAAVAAVKKMMKYNS